MATLDPIEAKLTLDTEDFKRKLREAKKEVAKMERQKIPASKYVGWMIAGLLLDFSTAWFLMMLFGSLGHGEWGYWHSWWVAFLGSSIFASLLYPVTRILDYIGERLS